VLACDGIYDVLENDELCALLRSRLSTTDNLQFASNQVLDVCLSKGEPKFVTDHSLFGFSSISFKVLVTT
jgi:serine/threonine protein phosphatase PrpC